MVKPLFPTISDSRITSHYGMRVHPISKKRKLHTGTDFAPPVPAQTGVPIYATMDGIVKRSRYSRSMGNYIYLDHTSDTFTSVYMHMSRLYVKENQTVKRGQKIGIMGTTGNSTGIHLHFMISKTYPPQHNGSNLINPLDYLKRGEKMKLNVDGYLGKNTIKRLQQFLGSKISDGKISKPSNMVKDLQEFLNKYGQ